MNKEKGPVSLVGAFYGADTMLEANRRTLGYVRPEATPPVEPEPSVEATEASVAVTGVAQVVSA